MWSKFFDKFNFFFFFFKQKTAYEIGTGDWSSDVCSSDLKFCVFCLVGWSSNQCFLLCTCVKSESCWRWYCSFVWLHRWYHKIILWKNQNYFGWYVNDVEQLNTVSSAFIVIPEFTEFCLVVRRSDVVSGKWFPVFPYSSIPSFHILQVSGDFLTELHGMQMPRMNS